MSAESAFKIEYDYQNPENVEAEVPGSQALREGHPTDLEVPAEAADGATIELRNGGYTVTKRSYSESSEGDHRMKVTRTTISVTTGSEDTKANQEIEKEKPRTKIPKLKFRQAAERVRAERRRSKEMEKSKETEGHIATRRSSIPKLTRSSKIPPPTTKPIVTKREVKETTVTSKPDEDFEKIYEEIIEHTDVTGELTDPEKVDSEFEEIIHAYDENKVQTPIPKIRQSKIPSLRRKSDHEIEGQKSSTRFAERSKVRSIPRLKEISMRAEEDKTGIIEIVRQYSQTMTTEKVSENEDVDLNDKMILDDTGGESIINLTKTDEVRQNEQILNSEGTGSKIIAKTSKITKITKSKNVSACENLPLDEHKTIEWMDDGMKDIERISKITTITKTNLRPQFEDYTVEAIVDNESSNTNKTTSTITEIIRTERIGGFESLSKEEQNAIAYNDLIDANTAENTTQTSKLTKVVNTSKTSTNDENFSIHELKAVVDSEGGSSKKITGTLTKIIKIDKIDEYNNNLPAEEQKVVSYVKLSDENKVKNIEKTSMLSKLRKPERIRKKYEDFHTEEIRTLTDDEIGNDSKVTNVITKITKIDKNQNDISDVEKKTDHKISEISTYVKSATEKFNKNDPNLITEEKQDFYDSSGKNIVKTSKMTKIFRNHNITGDLNSNDKDIVTINRTIAFENKNNSSPSNIDNKIVIKSAAQAENIAKTSVKVGIPIFNKQMSEIPTGKSSQTLQIKKIIERSTSEGGLSDNKTVTESKLIAVKSDANPIIEDYIVRPISSNVNINNKDQESLLKEINYSKISTKNSNASVNYKTLDIKNTTPGVTNTVTLTRLESNSDDTKTAENKIDRHDRKIMRTERNVDTLQPSILKVERISSKELSTTDNTKSEKHSNSRPGAFEIEQENTDVEVVELRGKVGRLINKIDTNTVNFSDIPKIDVSEELPIKKSVLSKIAMFERQEINEPMPRRKPRPEKIFIKEMPKEKSVHIHTPKIVEEVLKTKDLDDLPDNESPYDPFLTYKPLYEYLKTAEKNKSTEYLDTKMEAKTLEIKTLDSQTLPSPIRMSIEPKYTTKKVDTSSMVIDAPVILISPKIDVKKNINLNTDDNTAEFAKTVVSTMETKKLEVSTPVQINVDYEVSKIVMKNPEMIQDTSNTDMLAFKDVKKNVAMYENFDNTPKSIFKNESTYNLNHSDKTILDTDMTNIEVKIKEKLGYEDYKAANEITVEKEETKYEKVNSINEVFIQNKEDIYANKRPISEIVTLKEDVKYENVKPVSNIFTTKEIKYDFLRPNDVTVNQELEYKQIKPMTRIMTAKEEIIYKKARPVSEIIASGTEIQYENVRPISQILTAKDENNYEISRPITEVFVSKENMGVQHVKGTNDDLRNDNHKVVNRTTTSRHTHENARVINEVIKVDNNVFSNETNMLEAKRKISQSKKIDDDMRRAKSVAELDLGDAVKGKVNSTILRMRSVDRLELDRREIINIKEMPRLMSVSEKIALFESKATPVRSDSVFISCRPRMVRSRAVVQMSEEDCSKKMEELTMAKMFGRVAEMPSIALAGGATMPVFSVGTAQIDRRLTKQVVGTAIDLGYRSIDAAYIYGNEKEIGEAIREKITDGSIQREELFIVSKLWSTFHRPDLVEKACKASLDAMGLEYFDLYLIHNPMSFKEGDDPIPKIATVLQYSEYDYLDAWYGMERLVTKGLVKNIGLSNFNSVQIQRILDKGKIKPVVNQVECHPYLTQQRLDSFCAERNIVLSCFGVLGSKGTPAEYKSANPPVIDDPLVQVMASGLNMTPAQLLIRYQIQCGHNVVVKTATGTRLWENLQALNYTLTPGQIDALHALNRNKRIFTFSGMGDTHKNYPFKIAY